ncbi:MAG TPA: hypothetical protein HA257_09110 [Candidatus Methanoperedenaceae archaeon]|nr:hypothetical protein [Candidatus Methanoperedenaceae archaeon]
MRIRIEITEDDGSRTTAEFDGTNLRGKLARFMESLNLESDSEEVNYPAQDSLTLRERFEMFLKFECSQAWLTSLEAKRRYENVYGRINLSTVSTYLARMYQEGLLERRGSRTHREYRMQAQVQSLPGKLPERDEVVP